MLGDEVFKSKVIIVHINENGRQSHEQHKKAYGDSEFALVSFELLLGRKEPFSHCFFLPVRYKIESHILILTM